MGFRGTERQVFVIPEVVEDHIEKSSDWSKVRSSIWKAVYQLYSCFVDQDTFDERDMSEMKEGRAPYCHESQQYEGQKKMCIHHKVPRHKIKSKRFANRLANLIALSPLMHSKGRILTNKAHYGEYHGERLDREEEEKERKKRESIS